MSRERAAVVAKSGRRSTWAWVGLVVLIALVIGGFLGKPTSSPPPQPIEVLRQRVDQALQAKDYEGAIAILDRMEAQGGSRTEDQIRRAGAELGRERLDEVLRIVADVPLVGPDGARARLLAGQVSLRRHRLREAEPLFREAIALDPTVLQARRELVYVYGMREQRTLLHEQFLAMSQLVPLDWSDLFLWCLTRASDWYPPEHVPFLEKVIAADPEDQAARLSLSNSLAKLGAFREAKDILAPLNVSDPNVRLARAHVAMTSGDLAETDRLLAEGPDNHLELNCLRGQVAMARRDAAGAIRWFRKAVDQDPLDRDAVAGIGRAYQLAGDSQAARPYLELSQKFDELSTLVSSSNDEEAMNDPKRPLRLARACEAVGRIPEARGWTKLAIARDPLDPEPQRLLYLLDHRKEAAKP
jgi:tetratricopeptide (TPR) repeat protein